MNWPARARPAEAQQAGELCEVRIAYWRGMYAYREAAVKAMPPDDLRLANQEAKQDYPAAERQRAIDQRLCDGCSTGSVHDYLSCSFR